MLNDYKEFKQFLNELKDNNIKPTLLLHTCCAPCSTHTLKLLKEYFDIKIYYSNDNIYPYSEFELRLNEQIRFAKDLNIEVIYDEYNSDDYFDSVKGLENLGERSNRCYKCYYLRLNKTALKAKELGFDYFTTSLSISPHKVAKWINEIGYYLENKYDIKYLYSDFKKEEGYKESIKLSKEYNLYRQDYCGCIYSKNEKGD